MNLYVSMKSIKFTNLWLIFLELWLKSIYKKSLFFCVNIQLCNFMFKPQMVLLKIATTYMFSIFIITVKITTANFV